MANIHPTAIVDPLAELAADVSVGAYSIIEGRVSLGSGCVVDHHCIIRGHTTIGANCRIGPAAFVGLDPQHMVFDGSETSLSIGDGTCIREGASIHRALHPGVERATRIGRRCFLMGDSHVGHDCNVGDDVVLAQGTLLGGHVVVGDRAFLGGGSVIHQFCRIGRIAVIAGNEAVSRDVPPFAAVRYSALKGYNAVGCRRAGLSRDSIHAVRRAYHCLLTHRTTPAAVESIRGNGQTLVPEVEELLGFIAGTKRGIQPSLRFIMYVNHTADPSTSVADH